ncbi:hypothetical protein FOZ62_031352 [Perkinsus olseni]|uniref:Ion transport domain-containing protein n=1 Tax=Perkinsus olseni TaxID=32597 RepID=A0A7J6SAP2_PEROL|nr:hypothetical protein FOZ62_031352 [Perkinsus olseni]
MPTNEYLRVLLLVRVFKAERYVAGFAFFRQILRDNRAMLVYSGGLAVVIWLLSAEVMYYTERYTIDPEVGRYYSTLDGSLWLTLLNLSGESPLGDYSFLGSIITAGLGLFAVGVVAVPLGVLGTGMQDRLEALLDEDVPAAAAASKQAMTATSEALRTTYPLQRRVFALVNPRETDDRSKLDWFKGATMQYWSSCYQHWLGFWLAISTLVAVLETLPSYHQSWPSWSRTLMSIGEAAAVLVFTLDYGMRLYCAPLSVGKWASRGYVNPSATRWAYATTFLAVVDLFSILPWWITVSTNSSLTDRYDGEFRLLRLCRILNLDFLSSTCSLLLRVVKAQRRCLVRAFYVVLALWLSLGGLLWFAEHTDSQLAGDPPLSQDVRYGTLISASFPYAMVHLTGDFPIIDYTASGKVVLAFAVVLAVGVTAVPAGLLAAAFTEALRGRRERERARRREAAGIIGKHVRRYMVRKRLEGIAMEARLMQMRELAERRKRTLVHRVHCLIHHERFYSGLMMVLILLNILAVLLESDGAILSVIGKAFFDYLEFISVTLFTVDYLARLYSAPANPLVGCRRARYIKSFLGLVDVISILPFWIECLVYLLDPSLGGLADASIFRVFRIFRILLLEHFLIAWRRLSLVWYECKDAVLSTGVIAAVVWLFVSCLFYEFENPPSAAAVEDSPFDSIPSCMYYTAVFLGGSRLSRLHSRSSPFPSGDWGMVDFSPPGKCLCVVVALLGVALFSLPAGLVFEAFGDVSAAMEAPASLLVYSGLD